MNRASLEIAREFVAQGVRYVSLVKDKCFVSSVLLFHANLDCYIKLTNEMRSISPRLEVGRLRMEKIVGPARKAELISLPQSFWQKASLEVMTVIEGNVLVESGLIIKAGDESVTLLPAAMPCCISVSFPGGPAPYEAEYEEHLYTLSKTF